MTRRTDATRDATHGDATMGLIVYAVCRTGGVDPAGLPRGCGGGAVHAVCTERVAALISERDEPFGRADDADFDSFDGVVGHAHAQGATLPVRFGTFFSDDALLSRGLRTIEDALVSRLCEVDGVSEIGVTLRQPTSVVTRPARVASPEPAVAGFDGTGALKIPAPAQQTERALQAGPVEDPSYVLRHRLADLHAIAERTEVEDPIADAVGGSMRCLVRDGAIGRFRETFERLREEHGFDGRVGSASPCYHFATQTLC
ncbi:MAG: GvpL/GvpF family gas vesicle protein [Planctomycetota bacterium]